MTYDRKVKYIDWNLEKNEKLIAERGVGFEDMMDAIIGDGLLAVWDNPNNKQYAGQRMYVVNVHGYVHLVPYMEDQGKIFLKTVFPSRKYTKIFRKKGQV